MRITKTDFEKSRTKIATELMRNCPTESHSDHQKIALAIKNCLSFDSICDTTDIEKWPDTYHWVKTELGE